MSNDQIARALPIARAVGLTSGGFLTAYVASFSIATVPALLAAPAVSATDLAKQWRKAYILGKATAPPVAIVFASCMGFLAYHTRNLRSFSLVPPYVLYGAAAVLAPSIVPFTLLVMAPGIHQIEARSEGKVDAPSEDETKALIQKWSGQNLVRVALVGTAMVVGIVAELF